MPLVIITWWRHQMEIFSTLLVICVGNSPVPSEFPTQRPVTRSFDVFFDLHPNKRLSKQWWGWWFETPSCQIWRHCYEALHKYRRGGYDEITMLSLTFLWMQVISSTVFSHDSVIQYGCYALSVKYRPQTDNAIIAGWVAMHNDY